MKKFNLLGCTSMVALSLTAFSAPALAQEVAATDEGDIVTVTGIRRSLAASADIKRNESGVVDAITAEDIGKFPDANLAESLQRITGVSIDRQNNEGNQISVRGLGPSFNLVTLNGRQMPVASSPELETISSQTQSRAFNFAEIASESVSGVNVYKTARADLPTGGIGATVDIRTARPFDFKENQAVLSAAGVYDFSSEVGSAVTPEIGGLASYVYEDKFGVLINGSFSRRNFRESESHLDGWDRNDPGSQGHNNLIAAGAIDATEGTVYSPRTHLNELADNQRERINLQGVVQFRPVESFTVTADYTLSRFSRDEQRYQTGLFGLLSSTDVTNNIDGPITLTENGSLASINFTPTRAADLLAYDNELRVENDSFGVNAKWESDSLTLEFDGHLSQAESQPDGQLNDNLALYQGPLGIDFGVVYNGSSAPTITFDDSGANRNALPNIDSLLDPDGASPLGSVVRSIAIKNEVDQAQFRGTWHGQDGDLIQSLDFGVAYTEYQVTTSSLSTNFVFQGLGDCVGCEDFFTEVASPGTIFPSVLFYDANAANTENFPTNAIAGDFLPAFEDIFTTEESFSAYVNVNLEGEFNGMIAKLSAGVRYEDTDVESSSTQNLPLALRTTSPSEQEVVNTAEEVSLTQTGNYSHFLPAVDFQLQPSEDWVVRLSYGRTLARPDLNALRPSLTIADTRPFGPFNAGQGNPGLLPYLADNIDFSVEWYYQPESYASVTFFHKNVQNYIGTEISTGTINDVNGNPLTDPSPRFDETIVPPVSVDSQPTDPVAIFNITQSVNTGDANINGLEFAVQHVFGETGFGMQANYTLVDSSASFDPQAIEQTVNLIGLSDSANLVAFYENDKFQVRVAANYRDKFLFSENQLRTQGEPIFFDDYIQVDASMAYNYNDNVTLFFEALNITGEDQLQTGRFDDQFLFDNDQKPRITFGVRGEL